VEDLGDVEQTDDVALFVADGLQRSAELGVTARRTK